MLGRIKGPLFGILLFLSSFLGIIFLTCWSIPVFFLRPKFYRQFLDACLGWWECFCAALLEHLLGIKVVISGDEIQHGERSIIMMNHRTCLDWMYFWSVLVRTGSTFTEKIILKSDPKRLPGAGWAMQCGAFIFLQRKWEKDKMILTDMLDYFTNLKHKTQILLFPEGTDFSKKSKQRSDAFAEKNSLPYYEYVLHPRTTGFTFLATEMHRRDMLDAIYDVSIAYPKDFPCKELELLSGHTPQEVHFRIKRYSIDEVDVSEEGLENWCRCRWAEKEEQLKTYYEQTRTFPGPLLDSPEMEGRAQFFLKLSLVFWSVFIAGWCVVLWYSWLARAFVILQVVFFVGMDFSGGWELFQARYTNKMFGPRPTDNGVKPKSQ